MGTVHSVRVLVILRNYFGYILSLILSTWRGKAICPWQRAPLWGICKFLLGLLKGHQGKDQGQQRQLPPLPPLNIGPECQIYKKVLSGSFVLIIVTWNCSSLHEYNTMYWYTTLQIFSAYKHDITLKFFVGGGGGVYPLPLWPCW